METGNFRDTIRASECIYLIGVAGDSGSGKTTFTRAFREIFGPDLVCSFSMDDYHILDRDARAKRGITPLHPDANNISLFEEHISLLKQGRTVSKPSYNHTTGTFDAPSLFSPKKIVIVEGLHPFSTAKLRRLFDFTCYVDPDDEVKFAWKIARDVGDRGYSRDQVTAEICTRKPDYEAYVAPQKQYADAILKITPSVYDASQTRGMYAVSLLQERFEKTIKNIVIPLDLFAMTSLAERDFLIGFRSEEQSGRKMGAIRFDGDFRVEVIRRLEEAVEEETGVGPVSLFAGREYVTATEAMELILAWRIINRRIFMECRMQADACMKVV
ncbi:phosphoribulokinase [Methanogenium sp. S4BF]|uniref:phosphoribulokinase n=1 Tax=Methanogenium sp. S4BF TaxID=1789226 RepID=UPI002415C586|nr:phosphoribulokinase [Methanogenium sp. S4BF]WFN34352.1 phosphoribulokinase [Methanogenium sp. S4BF]